MIERRLQAQGIRRTRYAEVMAQAKAYLAEHEGLFDQATERVQRNPTLRAMAEREERERERQWRKSGVVERSVS